MTTGDQSNFGGAPKKPRFGPKMIKENRDARDLAILLLEEGFDFMAVATALNNEFGSGEGGVTIDRQVFQHLANKAEKGLGIGPSPNERCLHKLKQDYGNIVDISEDVKKGLEKYKILGKYFAQPESVDAQNYKWLSKRDVRLAVAFLWEEAKVRYIPSIQTMLAEMYDIKGVGTNALRRIFYEKEGTQTKEKLLNELKSTDDAEMMDSIRSAVSTWYRKGEEAKAQARVAAKTRWSEAQAKLEIIGTPVHVWTEGKSKCWYINPESLALVIYMLSKRVKGKRTKEGSAPNIAKAVLYFYGFPIDEESIKNQLRKYSGKKDETKTDAELFIEDKSKNVTEENMVQAEKDFDLWQAESAGE